MVLQQFVDTIGKLGVQKIEAKGERFDPSLHEAIQQIETSDQPAGTVVADLLSGYKIGDRLVRASMVVVAKAPTTPVPETGETGEIPRSERVPTSGGTAN